jgi:uncharacterized protein (DUF1800 family)
VAAGLAAGLLAACGGGSGGSDGDDGGSGPPPSGPTGRLATPVETSTFLTQATFGPAPNEIDRLTGGSASQWFIDQTEMSPTYLKPTYDQYRALIRDNGETTRFRTEIPTIAFWQNAVGAPDQLRQRVAFALSQILVTSASTGRLRDTPEGMIYYQDLLIEHAFGNYRDLLEDVTYSPAMGYYLTYIGSKKADPNTGRMPDENYARELLQLFTIGVVEIDSGGEVVTGSNANAIELFDNDDITGLARVFTGFEYALDGRTSENRRDRMAMPLVIDARDHSEQAKTFLGLTIPAGTSGEASVDQALDHIMAQPTVAPFIARQLIQRLTTSNPSPAYVRRVAEAFEQGQYQLPNFVTVGQGRRGDLTATIAAVLFDPSVSDVEAARNDPEFGKIREPVLRLAHWARAFEVTPGDVIYRFDIYDTRQSNRLSQGPYRAPSVFNFYRPGFIAPGSETGNAGMTVPELQIMDSTSVAGFVNYLDNFVLDDPDDRSVSYYQSKIDNYNVNLSAEAAVNAWVADYEAELALLSTPEALIDHLDLLLTQNTLSPGTRALLLEQLNADAATGTTDPAELRDQVQLIVLLIMSSPDYLVQR